MSELHVSPINPITIQGNLLQAVNRILSLFGGSGKSSMLPAVGSELPSTTPFNARGRCAAPRGAYGDSSELNDSHSPCQSLTRSSSISIPFDDDDVDVVRVEGLRHAEMRLEAR